jgi:hypothetical protein
MTLGDDRAIAATYILGRHGPWETSSRDGGPGHDVSRATCAATAATRRTRAGPAAPASRCSSCSTTRKAPRIACSTAIRTPRPFCRRSSAPSAYPMRHMSMESLFEYGSRAGLWRVLRAFEQRGLPLTVFGVARALQRHPEAVAAYRELGPRDRCAWPALDQLSAGRRGTERAHLAEAVAILTQLTGAAPLGWYTGRDSPNTRRLVVEHGGFLYDSDSYADDLPYWTRWRAPGRRRRTWSSPTRSTATTCASPPCRVSIPAPSSSITSRTPSTRLVPRGRSARARRAQDALRGPARAALRPAGPHRGARALSRLRRRARARVDLPAHRHRPALDRHAPSHPAP